MFKKYIFVPMALILAIESSESICSVALFKNAELLGFREKNEPNVHSQFLFTLIGELMQSQGYQISNLGAVAVNLGPGSYTGLRIGCTAAKAIAYSNSIPLIGLEGLSLVASAYATQNHLSDCDFICSMVDARRMEVFWQFFNWHNEELTKAEPAILTEVELPIETSNANLHVIGSGAFKCVELEIFKGAKISTNTLSHAKFMGPLLFEKWNNNEFQDVAYFEPSYLKGFHFVAPKKQRKPING